MDLKNPFNGIIGLSEYLVSNFENINNDEAKDIIKDINISSRNTFNLLQNLLEWTKAENRLIENVPVYINPPDIVSIALQTVSSLAKNKEITIKENYQTTQKGFADENLVLTVIRNLITNAIKFSPRNSVVEIISNTYKNKLYFCIKDQGIGISDTEIDQLFRIDTNFKKKAQKKKQIQVLDLFFAKNLSKNVEDKYG